jgi:pantothenate kinase
LIIPREVFLAMSTLVVSKSEAVEQLARRGADLAGGSSDRILLALSGPPASGKSTLASAVTDKLTDMGLPAILVPMDGFHLDNQILRQRGILDRKGAPETFDASGFVHAIKRLKSDAEVAFPSFDRSRDIAIAGTIAVERGHKIAVVEGNYLCFNEEPWRDLQSIWDLSAWLDVPHEILEARLTQRWLDHGLSRSDAEQRARRNDIPNADRIIREKGDCDLSLRIADKG